VFCTTNTVPNFLKPRTHNTGSGYENSGIYSLSCSTCQSLYVGQKWMQSHHPLVCKYNYSFTSCMIRTLFICTRWFKYDLDDLCVNKSQFVPVIFEPPFTLIFYYFDVNFQSNCNPVLLFMWNICSYLCLCCGLHDMEIYHGLI
jgi:hypothetical protein